MRFQIEPPVVICHDDKPASNVRLLGPHGKDFPFRSDLSSFSDAKKAYAWVFEGEVDTNSCFTFLSDDREVTGARGIDGLVRIYYEGKVRDENNPDDWIYPMPTVEEVVKAGYEAAYHDRVKTERAELVERFKSDPEWRNEYITRRRQA